MGKVLGNGTGLALNRSSDNIKESYVTSTWKDNPDDKSTEATNADSNDTVSGLLYGMLQKEVINPRKAFREKDQSLNHKDDSIEMLTKKVDTLTRAMEVEAKNMRREVASMEKEVSAIRVVKEQDNRTKRHGSYKDPVNGSQLLSGRNVPRTVMVRNPQ